jgi:hypothetical protein
VQRIAHKHLCWCWDKQPKHDHCNSPIGGILAFTTILLKGNTMSSVTGSYVFPLTRKSGAALALTDIDHASLTRNGTEIQKLAPSAATVTFTDATPLTGTDVYDAFTITKDGFIGDTSNDASVIIAAADPASAGTLTATLAP